MTQAQQTEALRFTKKPVTIAASQWFKSGDHPAVRDISDSDDLFFTGMGGATLVEREKFGVIGTLESPNHLVTPGDWIITGVKGEHYPCKPDIFEATYAPETKLQQGKCLLQIAEPAAIHPDDAAVDTLAEAMKAKLAKQRGKGYSGWDTDCTQERLSELLRQHVDKGDPVDVANFCAFLQARGEGIAAASQALPAEYPHLPCSIAERVDFSNPAPDGGIPLYTPNQMRAYVDADRAQRAAAPQAVQPAVPFMHGIADGEGKAYFEEGCVAPEASHLQPEVDGLNSQLDEDEKPYRVVPLFTQPAAQGLDAQQYRIIDHGELIQAGDEFLRDDFTWQIDPKGIFVGTRYGIALRPARRALAAQAKQGGADNG